MTSLQLDFVRDLYPLINEPALPALACFPTLSDSHLFYDSAFSRRCSVAVSSPYFVSRYTAVISRCIGFGSDKLVVVLPDLPKFTVTSKHSSGWYFYITCEQNTFYLCSAKRPELSYRSILKFIDSKFS
jgi:hypothetical protein